MLTEAGRVPLARRAWLGNGRSGALVAADGTVDWLAPSTASPHLWRLLDSAGPAVRVGPLREGSRAERTLPAADLTYLPGTNVAVTRSEASGGRRLAVTDLLPWSGPGREAGGPLVRLVRALSGPIEVEVEVLPGPERGPRGERRAPLASGDSLVVGSVMVHAPAPFEPAPLGRASRWRSRFVLATGEEAVVTVSEADAWGEFDPPPGLMAARLIRDDTVVAWRSWVARLAYSGPYRAQVERAVLALGSLTAPSGATCAAGTTSLPRRPGSERSADDRWVRLRDMARLAVVMSRAGMVEESHAAETWLRRTVEEADRPWPSWYDLDGQPVPEPEELPLEGWRRNAPVRSGRTAGLRDLGLPGVVAAAVGSGRLSPYGRPDDPGPLSAAMGALAVAADEAADTWGEADHGRWEIERPARLYSAGRVELWGGLDRLARMARALDPLDLAAAARQGEARRLRAWLENEAAAADGSLSLAPGATEADAALLSAMSSGPWPAGSPPVVATVDSTVERLTYAGLLFRYSDRVSDERAGPDHPDLTASLEAVGALSRLGEWDSAHERMEAALAFMDPSDGPGLPAETADPVGREIFGNLPCTSTALALVEAAIELTGGPA